MPRRSIRNLTRQYDELNVDYSGKGATVSDEIQLTYQIDDLSPQRADPTIGILGVGTQILGVVGRYGTIELQVNNPGGIIIQALHMGTSLGVGAFAGSLFSTDAQVTLNGRGILTPGLIQGTALRGFQTVVSEGTLLAADLPLGAYRFSSPSGQQVDDFRGLFVRGPAGNTTFYLYLVFTNLSDFGALGARWIELADPENMSGLSTVSPTV